MKLQDIEAAVLVDNKVGCRSRKSYHLLGHLEYVLKQWVHSNPQTSSNCCSNAVQKLFPLNYYFIIIIISLHCCLFSVCRHSEVRRLWNRHRYKLKEIFLSGNRRPKNIGRNKSVAAE